MTPFDRKVRARIYELLVGEFRTVDSSVLADATGFDESAIVESLGRLSDEHRIALTPDGKVRMAHPFSGVPTQYFSRMRDSWWWANCAWDSLAILALLGDGEAHGPDDLVWNVEEGRVEPDGIVHLVVPARSFWDDVGFT